MIYQSYTCIYFIYLLYILALYIHVYKYTRLYFVLYCIILNVIARQTYAPPMIGLQRAYSEDRGTHKFIRKLMALPFLPSEHIQPLFDKMVERATSQQLTELVTYVESTWITSEMWPPATWSIFMRSTRTNNDIEGWHFRLNQRAQKGNLPFYMLLTLLTQEAAHVNLQVRLVSEKKLQRIQRSKSRQMQGTIFKLWEEYNDKNKSASQLLKSCAALHGPILE